MPEGYAPARVLVIAWDSPAGRDFVGDLRRQSIEAMSVIGLVEAVEAASVQHFDSVIAGPGLGASELEEFALAILSLDSRTDSGETTRLFAVVTTPAQKVPAAFRALLEATAIHVFAEQGARNAPAASRLSTEVDHLPLFDREQFRAQLNYDAGLIADVVTLFVRESAEQAQAMQEALERREGQQLSRLAHSLKGSLASLQAPRGRELAQVIERTSAAGDFAQAERAMRKLTANLEELQPHLQQLAQTGN